MDWRSGAVVHVYAQLGVFVVAVAGEMDGDEKDLLTAAWDEAAVSKAATTVVDLSKVTFADSALLNSLLDAARRHRLKGSSLVLAGPLPHVIERMFAITGVMEHFTFADSLDQALERHRIR
ncbi:STAS domain-containing protein [Streptomyces sp. NPDC085946]|uniref:STAS domain-containing protein n=1 Tax=Streptomyces sp. NPDC085946 TaxID=3365744 RepID=UPI0037D86BF1